MIGRHKFRRIRGGVASFAEVWVDVSPAPGLPQVEDGLPAAPDTDAGEVNARIDPTWVNAALAGVRTALAARAATNGGTAYRAVLVRVVGTAADTLPDAVSCAAGLATWEALGSPEPRPTPVHDGTAWTLDYPVAVPAGER
ncbi:MAG: hypothetical protein U0746_03440 [Gemmataceae bacterium]